MPLPGVRVGAHPRATGCGMKLASRTTLISGGDGGEEGWRQASGLRQKYSLHVPPRMLWWWCHTVVQLSLTCHWQPLAEFEQMSWC